MTCIRNLLGLAFGLALVTAWHMPAGAQTGGPNAQLLCYRSNQDVFSPGLNTSYGEGEWGICQGVLDGSALQVADEINGGLGDRKYEASVALPTYSTRNDANAVADVLADGVYGAGLVTPIPGDFPSPALVDGQILGAFASDSGGVLGQCNAVTVDTSDAVDGDNPFSNGVLGVIVLAPIDCDNGLGGGTIERVDVFFAIFFAPDGLRDIKGNQGGGQEFPGTATTGNKADGAAEFFSGPGPITVGWFVGDPTGIATVPFKIRDSETPDPDPEFAFISGIKFCDLDTDAACDGEKLVDGMKITLSFPGTAIGDIMLFTGAAPAEVNPLGSLVTLETTKYRGKQVLAAYEGAAAVGAYTAVIDCSLIPAEGLKVVISEGDPTAPIPFDVQTAPQDFGMAGDPLSALNGEYIIDALQCGDVIEGLDFGNVLIEPVMGDPHTIGFWGSLVKKAIHSSGAVSNQTCLDSAPGNDVLPFNGFNTSGQVATYIDESVGDTCIALQGIIDAGMDEEDLLCEASFVLPPNKDGMFDNPTAQLLAFLLNVNDLPEGLLIDELCVLDMGSSDPVPVGDIVADACMGGQDLLDLRNFLDAFNNLDPDGMGNIPCLSAASCPTGEIDGSGVFITDQLCAAP